MTIRDLSQFLEPWIDYAGVPSSAHPEGRTYRVPSPDRATGLGLAALAALGRKAAAGEKLSQADVSALSMDDSEETDFAKRVLGPAHDEMLADGVADMTVRLIARDAFYVFTSDESLADLVLRGEAAARTAARATSGQGTDGSKSSPASGGTPARTRSRASGRSSTTAKRGAVKKP